MAIIRAEHHPDAVPPSRLGILLLVLGVLWLGVAAMAWLPAANRGWEGESCRVEVDSRDWFYARLLECSPGVPLDVIWVESDRWGVRILSLECPARVVPLPDGCGVVGVRRVLRSSSWSGSSLLRSRLPLLAPSWMSRSR